MYLQPLTDIAHSLEIFLAPRSKLIFVCNFVKY